MQRAAMVMACCLSVSVEKFCSRIRRTGQDVKEKFELFMDRTHSEAEQVHKVSLHFLAARPIMAVG